MTSGTDLYRDFAYCMVTAAATAAATSIQVDETGRLPSNAQLAAGDFWMTFESTYSLGRFEIVRLVSKSVETGAGTLTVERGAHGSTAHDRDAGVILKHAVTAEMLRTLARARKSATRTTASLAAGAIETGTITLARAYRLLLLQVDRPSRVRIYTTVAKRDADLSRAIGTDPAANSGLMFEYVATAAGTFELSPVVDGFQNESTPGAGVPISITNRDTVAAAVTVTLTYVRTE